MTPLRIIEPAPRLSLKADVNLLPPATTTTLDDLLNRAERRIDALDRTMSIATGETRPILTRALTAAYEVCVALSGDPERRALFLARHRVRPHGKVENAFQPIVKALFKRCDRDIRSQVTRYAGALRYAYATNRTTRELADLLNRKGYRDLYQRYTASKASPQAKLERKRKMDAAVDALRTNEQVALPSNPITAGREGIVLLVAECTPDGAVIVGALDIDERRAKTIIASVRRTPTLSDMVRAIDPQEEKRTV